MVTTTCLSPNAAATAEAARRYPSLRSPYLTSYVDRKTVELSHRTAGSALADRDSGPDDSPGQRKRIAVACGRCRKRKIRCSGDVGNGQPCLNCRNAGVEPCQFLRVQSTELAPKGNTFSYNIDVSRLVQARNSSVVPSLWSSGTAYQTPLGLTDSQSMSHHRDTVVGSAPASYANRPYHAPTAWNTGCAEDAGVDYALCQPSFQASADSTYVANPYRLPSNGPPSRSAMLYMDTEAAYGYPSVSSASISSISGVRQLSSIESTSLSFQNLASSALSRSPSSGTDRLASTSAPRALLGSAPSLAYRTESRASTDYGKGALQQQQQQQAVDSSSSSGAASGVLGGYPSYESSHLSYNSHSLAGQLSRPGDGYMSSSAESLLPTEDTLGATGPCPDPGYPLLEATFHSGSQHPHSSIEATASNSAPNNTQPYVYHGPNTHEAGALAGDDDPIACQSIGEDDAKLSVKR
ncbi:hypothetical protein HIM_06724 [Hirsutella minnesotensis 3608]|uniref:Zn(2)-C6 fungal-type domain-containing protein n=1 Tax=Hirsutella minnesotensis 3608 TaxID=1043627 RepID=A0A0F7ZIM0_9HYPO|nr:hypothetical protein HIM_06724 [Hirsutella minnesotensis 3608]